MNHCLIMNIEERSHTRSLGPYRIAHWLRQNGWDAEVIDYCAHWTHDELAELCLDRINSNTKFIGFSSLFTGWTKHIDIFSAFVRRMYPHIYQISGSSSLPNLDMPNVDYHVYGFGEKALEVTLRYLFSNGEKPVSMPMFETNVIDASKYPAYPMSEYTVLYEDRDFIQPWEFLSIETARGCKFKCTFCNFSVLGVKGDYSTSAESFERQLKQNYDKWGIQNYVIAEETFNDRNEKVEKFSKVVKKLPFDPWFGAYIRADLLVSRPNEPEFLADMNVYGQFYGIETFNTRTAKAIRKGMDRDKMKSRLIDIKNYYEKSTDKYRGNISLITGLPHESRESLYNSLDWILENWNTQSMTVYALGIPVYGRQSTLSSTFANDDYKEIDIDVLYKKHNDHKLVDWVVKKNNILKKKEVVEKKWLMWENEEMDVVDAYGMMFEFQDVMKKHNFKKSTFAVSEFSGKNATLQDKLKLTINDVKGWRNEELEWIGEYKEMKLAC